MSNSRAKQPRSKKARKAMELYEVMLFHTQVSRCRKLIEATSLAQAKRKADEIDTEHLFDHELEPVHGELDVDSVKLLEGGEDNE